MSFLDFKKTYKKKEEKPTMVSSYSLVKDINVGTGGSTPTQINRASKGTDVKSNFLDFKIGKGLTPYQSTKAEEVVKKRVDIGSNYLTFKDTLKEVADNPVGLLPFLSGAKEVKDLAPILSSAYKIENNTANEKDIEIVKQWYQDEIDKSQKVESRGYRIGNILKQLPSFAGEIYLTGGIATGAKKATIKTGKTFLESLLKKGGKELLEEAAQKSLARKAAELGGKVAVGAVGELARTPVAGLTRIPAGAMQKMLPKQVNLEGQKELNNIIVESGEDIVPAFTKAFGEQYIELVSEQSGRLFNKFTVPVKNQIVKSTFIKKFYDLNPNADVGALRTLLSKAGWNGILEEFAEERVGEVGHALFQKVGLSDQEYSFPTREQMVDELIAFSIPGVGFVAAEKLVGKPVGLSIEDVSETPKANNLIEEAKKYKTADEFIKAKKPEMNVIDDVQMAKTKPTTSIFIGSKVIELPEKNVKVFRASGSNELLPGDFIDVMDNKQAQRRLRSLEPSIGETPENIKIREHTLDRKDIGTLPDGVPGAGQQVYAPDGISSLTDIFNKAKDTAFDDFTKSIGETITKEKATTEEVTPKVKRKAGDIERELGERAEALVSEDFKAEVEEFDDFEKEDQYQAFKKFAKNKKYILEIADEAELKKRARAVDLEQIDNLLYSGEQTADEVLSDFVDRLESDKTKRADKIQIKKDTKELKKETTKRVKVLKKRSDKRELIDKITSFYKDKISTAEEVKKELVDFAKQYLDLNEKGKLLSLIGKAKTKKDLDKGLYYISRLDEASNERKIRKALIQKIKTTKIKEAERAKVLKRRSDKRELIDKITSFYKDKISTAEEVKKELVDFAKQYLDLNEKGKLLSLIGKAKTKKDLDKGLYYISRLDEASNERKIRKALIQKIKTTKIKKAGGKPVGKLTPETQNVLEKIRSLTSLSLKQAQEKISQNLRDYPNGNLPPEVIMENRILGLYSGNINEIKELDSVVSQLKEKGEIGAFLRDFERQEEIDRKKNFVIKKVTGGKGIEDGRIHGEPRDKTTIEQIKQYLKAVGKNTILTWNGIMNASDFNSSIKEKSLADVFSVIKNESSFKELQSTYIETFNKNLSSIYEVKNKPASILKKTMNLATDKIKIGERTFTRDELIKRYMEFQDPTLYDSFIEGNGYTQKTFDDIEKALTSKDKEFAEWQLDYYQELYEKVNKVYSKMNGVNLPFNEFYSPIKREGIKLEPGRQEFLEEVNYRKAVTNKSLISRVSNLKPLAKQGSLQVLDRHLSEMNYYIAWVEKIKEFDSVFTDPSVRSAYKQEFPTSLLKSIDEKIGHMSDNGTQTGLQVGWIDAIRKSYVMGNLAVKPALAVKQMVSTIAYAEKINPISLVGGILDYIKNPIKNFKILQTESAFIKNRGVGFERDLKEAMKEGVFDRYKKRQTLSNKLLMNVKLGDKGAIIIGTWALRKKRLKQGVKLEDIISEYEEFASETQQSADVSRMSNVQLGGTFPKLFTMFMSSQRGYLQKELNAVKSLFRKDGFTPKNNLKVAKTLVIYHIILPVFFQYVSNMGGMDEDDRKDYLRAGILGSLNGLFIAGGVMDSMIRTVMGMRVWSNEIPILDVANDIQKITKKLIKSWEEDLSEEEFYSMLDSLSSAGTGLTGLPLEYSYDALESLYRGNFETAIKQVAGWSEYYIDSGEDNDIDKQLDDLFGEKKSSGASIDKQLDALFK